MGPMVKLSIVRAVKSLCSNCLPNLGRIKNGKNQEIGIIFRPDSKPNFPMQMKEILLSCSTSILLHISKSLENQCIMKAGNLCFTKSGLSKITTLKNPCMFPTSYVVWYGEHTTFILTTKVSF